MILLVDIGNTNTHLGLHFEGKIQKVWDMETLPNMQPEALMKSLRAQLPRQALLEGAALASVVPAVDGLWWTVLQKKFRLNPVWVTHALPLGIRIDYKPPSGVGADRLANAVGGFKKYGGPLIIVDFGTAVTFDVVDKDGNYLGGVISPGIGLTIDALHAGTALLPKIQLREIDGVLGHDTVSAMRAGIIAGFCGMIKEIVARLKKELGFGEQVKIIATGGYSDIITRQLPFIHEVNKQLTLEGLWEIHQQIKNAGKTS